MIQYRKAILDDLDFLVELRIRDLQMFSDKEIKEDTIVHIKEFYKIGLENQTCITILGYDKDSFIASASVYMYCVLPSNENSQGKVAQLTNIWVDDQYRHQGIASKMINELIDEMKENVGMICLNSSQDGIELYKRLGFIKKENYFVMYTE